MQEVCSSLDAQLSGQIKSESPVIGTSIVNGVVVNVGIGPPQPPPQAPQAQLINNNNNNGKQQNCDKTRNQQQPQSQPPPDTSYWMQNESGFINSQPSMAEFLTHIGPESPKMGPQGYPLGPSDSMDAVPEYPWMKEKKTARKNSAQGKCKCQIFGLTGGKFKKK